jgi:hypothetical protein
VGDPTTIILVLLVAALALGATMTATNSAQLRDLVKCLGCTDIEFES